MCIRDSVVQYEDRTIPRRQLGERGLDARGERRIAFGGGWRRYLGQPFVADLVAPTAPREVRERRVDGEPVDPRRERGVAAERREAAEHAHEHFLRNFLGVGATDDAMRHAKHAALVLVVELSLIHISEPTRLLSISYAV